MLFSLLFLLVLIFDHAVMYTLPRPLVTTVNYLAAVLFVISIFTTEKIEIHPKYHFDEDILDDGEY